MKMATRTIVFPYVRGALELSLGNESGAKKHFDKLRKVLTPPAPPPPPPSEEPKAKEGEKAGDENVVAVTNTGTPPEISSQIENQEPP